MPARRLDCGFGRESVYLKDNVLGFMTSKLRWKMGDDILGKCARQRLLAADLLTVDEGLDRDGDGTVNVLSGTVL